MRTLPSSQDPLWARAAACRYSSPGKRINHVKLLCQNFEALEDQLNSIQSDLSALTSLVRNGSTAQPLYFQGEDLILQEFTDCPASLLTGPRKDRHIVRNEANSIDRYHGPCSLYALCTEFHRDLLRARDDLSPGNDRTGTQVLLEQMCADASNEDHMDIPSEHAGVCLPPRQFLNIVVGPFFNNADYATDLFLRHNFQTQVDRVYSQTLTPMDEAWAVCFNVIVLLAIGKDDSAQSNNPFFQPFLQTLRMTVNNPRVFLTPRLVNVQALALLSHIAEQYSPPGFAELVFAQACLLARIMGLHQSRASPSGHNSEEILEKQKVFRSLYIRDKNFAICRGSSSWLPNFDSSITPLYDHLEGNEVQYAPRIELAHIQDEIYRRLHSAESPNLPGSALSHLLSVLEQKLDRWSVTHSIVKKSASSAEWASLALSFFATRLCIFRCSDDVRLSLKAFNDAKACCLLFLSATASKPNPILADALDLLLGRRQPSSPLVVENSEAASDAPFPAQNSLYDENDTVGSLPRLTAIFPLAAIFEVAKHLALGSMSPPSSTPQSHFDEELLLLETLRDRFVSAISHGQIDNLTRKLGRTLDTMLLVIRQKRFPKEDTTPSMIFNDLSSLHSSASSGSQRNNAGGSRKGSSPEPDAPLAVTTVTSDTTNTSSMLLPFMQPFESPSNCSPWGNTSTNPGIVNNAGLSPWPVSYKQQVDSTGRVGKRPRLPSQMEMLDMTAVFSENGQRLEDDPLSMFELFSSNNDIAVFDSEE
ncbi:hypothetical protein BGZ63DRAFT_413341 [Mariannaea sp. PMI_226]|nr:hypothetical protein BGZ63DRAFT_413341 [Mariannaea sp. PMI_226]